MTIIAAAWRAGRGCIASDSAVTQGPIWTDGGTKLRRIAPWLVVGTSIRMIWDAMHRTGRLDDIAPPAAADTEEAAHAAIAAWWYAVREKMKEAERLDDEGDMQVEGLALTPHGVYLLALDGATFRAESGYYATGSGRETALGAMHATRSREPERMVRAAIDAAVAHVHGCGGTVHLETV